MPELTSKTLPATVRYLLQALTYAAFAMVIGFFSTRPAYRQLADDEAVVKLSFSHSAQLMQACRERTEAELAKLAPNMRSKMDCPRERAPVNVELDMDDRPLYRIAIAPSGLHKDGAATVYRRLAIPAGLHKFHARLADGADGRFNFQREASVELAPGQVLIVDFLSGSGGFILSRGK
jgi:hypothetical protein